MKRANTRTNIVILSRWGDCVVRKQWDGKSVTIVGYDGKTTTENPPKKGKDNSAEPEKSEQTDFFGLIH